MRPAELGVVGAVPNLGQGPRPFGVRREECQGEARKAFEDEQPHRVGGDQDRNARAEVLG